MPKKEDLLNKNKFLDMRVAREAGLHISTEIWYNLWYTAAKFNQGGRNQVNQHVWSQQHKTKYHAKFYGKQGKLHPVQRTVTLTKPVEKGWAEADVLWAFKIADKDFLLALFGKLTSYLKNVCRLPISRKILNGTY